MIETPPQACRIAQVNPRFRDIFRYDGSRTHHHTVANRNGQYRCIRSDADLVPYSSRPPQVSSSLGRTSLRKRIVNEHRTVRNKAIISYDDELTDESVRLDPAAFPDGNAALDLYKWPNKAIVSDIAAVEVHGLDNRHSLSKADVNYTRPMKCRLACCALHNRHC
jgi:hypothetical protein